MPNKITPTTLTGGFADVAKLNANFVAIADVLNNEMMSRNNRVSGAANQLESDLDVNAKQLYNVPDATEGSHPVNYKQLIAALGFKEFTGTVVETAVATAGQTVFTLTSVTYIPGLNNLVAYVNGVRQHPSEYTETSTTVLTFSEGLDEGDQVLFVVNERAVGGDGVNMSSVVGTVNGRSTNVTAELSRPGVIGVADYTALRALDSKTFADGEIINVTNDGIAGPFVVKTGTVTDNAGTLIVSTDDANRYFERVYEYVTLGMFGADETGATDSTPALTALAAAFPSGGVGVKVNGTVRVTVGDVEMPSNLTFFGDGQGISTLEMHNTSNPASDTYIMTFTGKDNIKFKDLTLSCTAASEGIFSLGALVSGAYTPDQAGNQYGIYHSGGENITYENVEVKGFSGVAGVLFTNPDGVVDWNKNVNIINCYGHDNRETSFSLQAIDGFKVVGGRYENNGWESFDAVDSAGNPTSTTRTAANYIDGGTGYGIVIGRTTSANKLKAINGTCIGVHTARNKRHGIDIHAGSHIEIIDCHSEDDLITAWGCQDTAASLDNTVGDIKIEGGTIHHTVYSENRGSLFDDRVSGTERDDSNPIFVANIASEWKQVIIRDVTITNWRFRQISSYSATDTIMAITASANNKVVIEGINFIADNANYYPAKLIQASAELVVIDGNTFVYGTRGDFDRAPFRFESTDNNTRFTNNTIQEINVYSAGTTQVAHAMFEKTGSTDEPIFTGNHITRSTQGTLGSLCETVSGNAQWGFRGFWGVCDDNIIVDGTLGTIRYSERINNDLTFYISAAGSGNQDGRDASNPFAANNLANLQLIADQLPEVDESSTLTLQFADGSYTLSGTLTIPFDGWSLLGNSGEFSAATTKSVDFDNSAASDLNIIFPKYGRRSTMKAIQTRSANGLTVRDANILEYNVIENSASGAGSDYGFYKETGECFANSNYFTGGYAAIGAFENASVVSRVNDDTGTQPTYGLAANGAVIMKNSTQPTGSTANETSSNGGVIR